MSESPQNETPSLPGLGCGVYLLAGPVVAALAGIVGHFGERFAGGLGYWIGCYITAIAAALLAGLLFARLFHGHPLYWTFGALGFLIGGHLASFALVGKPDGSPTCGSDQTLCIGVALLGMFFGFAAAHLIVSRRKATPSV